MIWRKNVRIQRYYHHIKLKGVEYLRGVYLSLGISVRPKIKLGKMDTLIEIMRSWGLNPEKILSPEALKEAEKNNSI
jgi:hypothetical protein